MMDMAPMHGAKNNEEHTMRKIIVSEFVTLDGVMENPSWTFQFQSDEQEWFKFDELSVSDALLLGRVTYEGFAAAWPHMTEQAGAYADMMNGYPKYVVSTALPEPLEWNNATPIRGDVVGKVARLKQQPGKDILVFGSGALAHTLMQHGLIDEYRLLVFPIIVGSGKRLFPEGHQMTVRLINTRTFSSGVVALTYQPAEQGGNA